MTENKYWTYVALLSCWAIYVLVSHLRGRLPMWRLLTYPRYALYLVLLYLLASHAHASVGMAGVILFCYGAVLYVALCNLILVGVGAWLTSVRGEKWVRELEYPYLLFGALGVLIALNRVPALSERWVEADFLGPLMVVTALVIKLVRTRAEIAKWNTATFYEVHLPKIVEWNISQSGFRALLYDSPGFEPRSWREAMWSALFRTLDKLGTKWVSFGAVTAKAWANVRVQVGLWARTLRHRLLLMYRAVRRGKKS